MAAALASEDPPWIQMAIQARVRYRVPGMEAVTVRDTPGFDYYAPLEPVADPVPVVILIHGGPIPGNLLTGPTNGGTSNPWGA